MTGANFLLETGDARMLVDCGLVQGGEYCADTNYIDFPYDPSTIDVLIVTHAHIDHIGRIPRLVQKGFRGKILSTPPTKDISGLMLGDAHSIMGEEAERCHRDPLYTKEDVEQALSLWQTVEYHTPHQLPDDITLEFKDAGHILGSALVCLTRDEQTFVFTGDIGNSPEPLLRDTESLAGASYILMESVYGDRLHQDRDARRDVLCHAIEEARQENRVLLIPSFSLQRTQVLLSEINDMVEDKKIEPIPIFLDSPLAIKVLDVYRAYPELYNEKTKARLASGDDIFDFDKLTLTPKMSDARDIEEAPAPKVIIAGSGMSHGGRILSHEIRYLSDRNATILFVGYQAVGSLGRRIYDGAKRVKIGDTWVNVHARIDMLSGYSAHRDRDGLIGLVEEAVPTVKKVFVAMGEPKASLFLTQRLRDFLGVDATAPELGASYTLDW